MAKLRADQLVAAQGLADSPDMAARLIMAGKITAEQGGRMLPVEKPGQPFKPDTRFEIVGVERFVSRGGYKLLTAIEHFGIDVGGMICLDAGASTGGFTDCLLQHGAARVYAVDVGKAQLHERLRADGRVVSLEGVNLRIAPADIIPEPVGLIVADVSFISLTQVLPHCMRWLEPGGKIVALVKPQFEVGAYQTEKGVVRDPVVQRQAVDKVREFCATQLGLLCLGDVPAGIKGPKGNQEFLTLFARDEAH